MAQKLRFTIATTTGLPAEGAGRKALGRHKRHAALSACCYKVTVNLGLVGGHMAVGGGFVSCLASFKALKRWQCLSVCPWKAAPSPGGGMVGGAPPLTGRCGRSGAWACRAARRGSAGRSPPAGSGRWSACRRRPGCTAGRPRRPSAAWGDGKRLAGVYSGGSKVGLAVRGVVLTGTIWKCLILCAWHSDSTKVFGLVWLSRSRKTLGGEGRRSHFLSASTAPFFHWSR